MLMDNDESSVLSVGSVVRIPCPTGNGRRRRAIIATLSSDTTSCLLDNDFIPNKNRSRYWIIKPLMKLKQEANTTTDKMDDSEDDEVDIPISEVQSLLPMEKQIINYFQKCNNEMDSSSNDNSFFFTALQYKECGDSLMRLRDYQASIEMYEAGIFETCKKVEIGGTIILNRKGNPVLAEIDCIEEKHSTTNGKKTTTYLDVTHISGEEEEETVVLETQVLLVIMSNDTENRLQERILLNMARCLLQLAQQFDINDNNKDIKNKNRHSPEGYRKAAILACTLVLACVSFNNHVNGIKETEMSTSLEEKARILRAMAYKEDSNYYKHAMMDLKKVIQMNKRNNNQSNSQAEKLLAQIQNTQAKRKQLDRKLAKDVCKWIESSQQISDTMTR